MLTYKPTYTFNHHSIVLGMNRKAVPVGQNTQNFTYCVSVHKISILAFHFVEYGYFF